MQLSEFFPEMRGWTPAQLSEQPKPQIPEPQLQVTPFLRATLPLPLQYSPDTLKQYNRPGLSSFRTPPTPPGGSPSINSASSSVTQTTVIEAANTSAAGPNGAVQFSNGGTIAGVSQLDWNNNTSTLSIVGTLSITGSITITGTISASVFNATTGFEVGGAAPSGHILVGNGTNYVDGTAPQLVLWNIVSKNSNYNSIAGDMVKADTSGGGFTVFLPSASSNSGKAIRVKKITSDANTITVSATIDLIDGQTTQFWTSQYTELEVTSDGSTWNIV